MGIIQFDLAAERGGKKLFDDLSQAIAWARSQEGGWVETFDAKVSYSTNRVVLPSTRWRALADDLQLLYSRDEFASHTVPDAPDLVPLASPVFKALDWVADRLPVQGIEAAFYAAGLGGKLNWADPAEASGVLLYERVLAKNLENSASDAFSMVREDTASLESRLQTAIDALSRVEDQISQIATAANDSEANSRDRVSSLEASVSTLEFSANERLASINADIETATARLASEIADLTTKSKKAIDNWFAGFKEQRELEAPVLLWETRASKHEQALQARRWWMIGVGVAGIIVAVFVAVGSFALAQKLFGAAIVASTDGVTPTNSGMRPSFNFELLFASAGTLIYLTMYLWAMKLLVRLYTTEHHLALDAHGRAALTETYLSLTSKGAATDADRAIMLSVIFRPVADGMVKEDGPPAISPAAILAGLASNTNKSS